MAAHVTWCVHQLTVPWLDLLVTMLTLQCLCGQNLDRETAESRLCTIDNGLIHCANVPLSTQNVTVLGNIHACTKPVYIQFVVGLTNSRQKDEYTFINDDETQRVRGVDQYVNLRVILRPSDGYIFLKAEFLEEGYEVYFLETHLDMPDKAQCANAGTAAGRVLPIAIVAVAAIILATAATLLLFWWYKKRQRAKKTANELLADMESSATAIPYQEEPIASNITGPKPTSTTVIQNSVYRDSLVVEDSSLDTITEEGDDNGSSSNGRNHKQKHRSKQIVKERPRKRPNQTVASKNGYNRGDSDLVDISSHGNPDMAAGALEASSGSGSGGAEEAVREGMGSNSKSAVVETSVIARIAPPPQICVSPSANSRSKEFR